MATEQEMRAIISRIPFWDQAPQELLDFCIGHGRIRRYSTKQYLYFSGDEVKTVFILLRGRVQLVLTSEFTEKIFRILRPPVFFPEIVLDGKNYPQAALALEPTEVLALDSQTVIRFLQQSPQAMWPFYRSLALDLRRAYRQVRNLSLGDARLRLGAKIFALAHAHGKACPEGLRITIPLSATELAAMCGLARESVSRILGELREADLLQVEKKNITITQLDGLRQWIRERSER